MLILEIIHNSVVVIGLL